MAISQKLLSMDEFYRSSSGDKLIVNDLSYFDITDIETLNANLMTVYESDTLSTVPSCDCGKLKSRYLLNKTCNNCGSVVREAHDKVEPLLWLKSLDPSIKFINPTFWIMLKKLMHKDLDLVRWMCDNRYNPPNKLPNYLLGVREILQERTYDSMISKLPDIFVYMKNHADFKKSDDKMLRIDLLLNMYLNQKDKIFSDYLPIVNKKLFVMENTRKGRFTNLAVSEVIDIVMLWSKTVSTEGLTRKKANQVTGNVISKFATLYYEYFEKYLMKKSGAFRKHVYGARSHFTFRSVIISIAGPHKYNEIFVPWSIGVTAFRPHLLNKLVNKHQFTYKKASRLLYKSVRVYDPLIEQLLNELIAESPYELGIPVILNRNPSLHQASSQRLFISKFHNDPSILTISISTLIAKGPNAISFLSLKCAF